ncbi:hypothetical protein WT83_19210 [Burkholderia territorii]|uniref:Uncharacterized protein n=1 Tax=Burkholderia territorii TaxID=1503055 RepID=A0A108EI34_9BURK|nr:hypothetical protein WT83_19210 [Burkholderia territorii]
MRVCGINQDVHFFGDDDRRNNQERALPAGQPFGSGTDAYHASWFNIPTDILGILTIEIVCCLPNVVRHIETDQNPIQWKAGSDCMDQRFQAS